MLTDPVSLPLWTLNNLVSRPIRPSVPESLRAFNEGFTEGRISAVEDCEYTTGRGSKWGERVGTGGEKRRAQRVPSEANTERSEEKRVSSEANTSEASTERSEQEEGLGLSTGCRGYGIGI